MKPVEIKLARDLSKAGFLPGSWEEAFINKLVHTARRDPEWELTEDDRKCMYLILKQVIEKPRSLAIKRKKRLFTVRLKQFFIQIAINAKLIQFQLLLDIDTFWQWLNKR